MSISTNPMKTPIKTLPNSENSDPNHPKPSSSPSPCQKPTRNPSSLKSSSKPKKPISRLQSPPPPPPQQPQRKFIVAKKKKKSPRNDSENSKDFDPAKCREAAYEALRASQDDFFRKDCSSEKKNEEKEVKVEKMRTLVMEEALSCIPEPGSGRVMHLVKAFENMLSISDCNEEGKSEGRKPRVTNWALPGMREPLMMMKSESSKDYEGAACSVFSSTEFVRDSRLYSSLDSNGNRLSLGSRTSNGSRRSRRSV